MLPPLEDFLQTTNSGMQQVYEHLKRSLAKINVNRVSISMLDSISFEHNDAPTSISQIASISVQDAATLLIKPWEKGIRSKIERAIIAHNPYGFLTRSDGELLRVIRPPLTGESRERFRKQIDAQAEQAKISIRNVRKKARDHIKQTITSKDEAKRQETELEKLTSQWITTLEALHQKKRREIMVV